jgi:hypothetical protein
MASVLPFVMGGVPPPTRLRPGARDAAVRAQDAVRWRRRRPELPHAQDGTRPSPLLAEPAGASHPRSSRASRSPRTGPADTRRPGRSRSSNPARYSLRRDRAPVHADERESGPIGTRNARPSRPRTSGSTRRPRSAATEIPCASDVRGTMTRTRSRGLWRRALQPGPRARDYWRRAASRRRERVGDFCLHAIRAANRRRFRGSSHCCMSSQRSSPAIFAFPTDLGSQVPWRRLRMSGMRSG